MIYAQLYLLLATVVMGARDGINYRVFGKPVGIYANIKKQLKWWHWLGGINYVFVIAPVVWLLEWKIIIAAMLIRVAFYDVVYNKLAGMVSGHLGTEAGSDKLFARFFGKDGAVNKMWAALLLLIIINLLNVLI
jgi:hypothetical protein